MLVRLVCFVLLQLHKRHAHDGVGVGAQGALFNLRQRGVLGALGFPARRTGRIGQAGGAVGHFVLVVLAALLALPGQVLLLLVLRGGLRLLLARGGQLGDALRHP